MSPLSPAFLRPSPLYLGTKFTNEYSNLADFLQFVPTVPTFFRSEPRGFFTGKGQLLSQPRWPQGTNARDWMMFFGGDMGTRPKMPPKNRPVSLYMSDFLLSYCYGDILGTLRGRLGDADWPPPILGAVSYGFLLRGSGPPTGSMSPRRCNLDPYGFHLSCCKHMRVLA